MLSFLHKNNRNAMTDNIATLRHFVLDVPDFPEPGIIFRDITPILADAGAFATSVAAMADHVRRHNAEEILAIESRGFVFGATVAHVLGLPFHLFRKPGKLPRETVGERYSLEYGEDGLELHADVIEAGTRYAIIDDVIATGGTAGAACRLVTQNDGEIACCSFLIELKGLNGRQYLGDHPIEAVLEYD